MSSRRESCGDGNGDRVRDGPMAHDGPPPTHDEVDYTEDESSGSSSSSSYDEKEEDSNYNESRRGRVVKRFSTTLTMSHLEEVVKESGQAVARRSASMSLPPNQPPVQSQAEEEEENRVSARDASSAEDLEVCGAFKRMTLLENGNK